MNGAAEGVGTFAGQISRPRSAPRSPACAAPGTSTRCGRSAQPSGRLRIGGLRRRARSVRLILDNIGNRTIRDLRRAVTPTGMVIVNGGGSPGHLIGAVGAILRAAVVNLFVVSRSRSSRPHRPGDELLAVVELVEAGTLRPVIDRTYPLADTAAGPRYVEAGHARGKVVITVT